MKELQKRVSELDAQMEELVKKAWYADADEKVSIENEKNSLLREWCAVSNALQVRYLIASYLKYEMDEMGENSFRLFQQDDDWEIPPEISELCEEFGI